jgi:Mg2+ and Co2+ transporter CorA
MRETEVLWLSEGRAERIGAEEIAAFLARPEGFVWMDVRECDDAVADLLARTFGCHPLAIHDCKERNHIAKLRVYGDQIFVVLHAPEAGTRGQVHLLELDYFAGLRHLLTLHGPANPEIPLESLVRETRAVARRIEGGRFQPRSPAELSHAIASGLVARQEAFVRDLAKKVADLERHVLAAAPGQALDPEASLEEMFRARHELLTVRTMAAASREVYARMAALARFLPPEVMPFVEDLVDQFERVRAVCDGEKEFLQGVVDFYQSRTATKMNIAMERLALISAVLLPITAITGIYGMNIIVNERTEPYQVAGVLGAVGAVAVLMLRWARRRGWW